MAGSGRGRDLLVLGGRVVCYLSRGGGGGGGCGWTGRWVLGVLLKGGHGGSRGR